MRKIEEIRILRMSMQYKSTCKKKSGRPRRRTLFDGIGQAIEKREMDKVWSLGRPRWKEVLENTR